MHLIDILQLAKDEYIETGMVTDRIYIHRPYSDLDADGLPVGVRVHYAERPWFNASQHIMFHFGNLYPDHMFIHRFGTGVPVRDHTVYTGATKRALTLSIKQIDSNMTWQTGHDILAGKV